MVYEAGLLTSTNAKFSIYGTYIPGPFFGPAAV